MLNVSNLTRRYGNFIAVENVSFSVKKGEIIGLLGHNGAGKTTIMKTISGFLEADSGDVCLDGISAKNNAKALQRVLGYLPENLPVYPEMSVAEYLDYAADMKGLKGNTKTAEIKRAIKATDLSTKLLAPIDTLSRGYKQRVGVAQAILGQPKLLILDEPTNGLDPEQTHQMRKLIKEIAQKATVILSTHIMQEVNALCDRVLILKGGKLVLDDKLSTLKTSQHIELRTNCTELSLISSISGVKHVEQIADNTIKIEVSKINFIDKISAEICSSIICAGFEIYSIYAQKQDLESVFNHINNDEHNSLQKEVSNAA